MKKFLKWITTTTKRIVSVVLGLIIGLMIWGCSTTALVPTVVPPLMDTLIEGDTPHIPITYSTNMPPIKLTVQGIVDARMMYLEKMYPVVRKFYDDGAARSERTGLAILGIMSTLGLGGAGMVPWALKRVPKGCIKQEEHEAIVKKECEKVKANSV